MPDPLSMLVRSMTTAALKSYVSRGISCRMASSRAGIPWPWAETYLAPLPDSGHRDLQELRNDEDHAEDELPAQVVGPSIHPRTNSTYLDGKLESARTISSPWPMDARACSRSGDKICGNPFSPMSSLCFRTSL